MNDILCGFRVIRHEQYLVYNVKHSTLCNLSQSRNKKNSKIYLSLHKLLFDSGVKKNSRTQNEYFF